MCQSDYTESEITISVIGIEEVSEGTSNFLALRRCGVGGGAADGVVAPWCS